LSNCSASRCSRHAAPRSLQTGTRTRSRQHLAPRRRPGWSSLMSETATHGERLVRLGVIVGNSRTIMSETPASNPKPTKSELPASLKGYAQRCGLAETRLFVSPVAHVFTCKSGWSSDGLERALTALQRILHAIRESADLAHCPWPTVGIIDMSEQERSEERRRG